MPLTLQKYLSAILIVFTRLLIHFIGTFFAQWALVLALFFCSTISTKAQDSIDSLPAYLNFLSSIQKNKIGLIILSNNRCGQCLLAKDPRYLDKLDSILISPLVSIDTESDFGKIISMKHRINKLPAILILSEEGQLLHRANRLPREQNEIQSLELPFDTLPYAKFPLIFDLEYPEFFKRSFNQSASSPPSDDVLSLFFQMNPNLQDEVVWAVALRFDLSSNAMNRIITQRDMLISSFGKSEVFDKLDRSFFSSMKAAAKNRSSTTFESVIAKAELAFGQDEFDYTSKYKSYFYQLMGNWDCYLKLGDEINMRNPSSSLTLYEMAQVLLHYSNDEQILKNAADWFSKELSEENSEEADTKTMLLWRGGEEDRAKELALEIEALPAYSTASFPYTASILKGLK